jgi:methylamine methyltransferase corrinoid protein reductive activase
MAKLGIALDLGTSGFRGQAVDLEQQGRILSTAITTRHPLPGANVIDHLHFALEVGMANAHEVVIDAVNQVISNLQIDPAEIVKLAICGNPIQLSLFQEIEIRDLAYAGKRKLQALGVVAPKRDVRIVKASEIRGLDIPSDARVLIPPAVQHEIGADALAMMIQTNLLEMDKICVVTDYGTNNEMALLVNGIVYTGSTAAGPALEGQHIEYGLLALPGAISDLEFESAAESQTFHTSFKQMTLPDRTGSGVVKSSVLNADMHALPGDTVDVSDGEVISGGELRAVGITGTGVVALISGGIESGFIQLPKINTPDGKIHLCDGIEFSKKDLLEAGKAIGAVRAGHLTLCQEAGIRLEDIEVAYSSGASGTYVDALKAQKIGMIPPSVKTIYQVGNTSLAMARDMVQNEDELWNMKKIADNLRQHHCMFAESKVFEKVYILELSYWTEGMPLAQYQKFLKKYGFPPLAEINTTPEVVKTVERDIQDLGEMGLRIIPDIGQHRKIVFDSCLGDMSCVTECPEIALQIDELEHGFEITINLALCDGVACRRCERACKEKIFNVIELLTSKPGTQ